MRFILVFGILLASTNTPAQDALGSFIEEKKIGSKTVEIKPGEAKPAAKTKLQVYDDPMGQLLLDKGIIDAKSVELIPPTGADKAKFRSEYEATIQDLKKKGQELFLNTELSSEVGLYSKPGHDEISCVLASNCKSLGLVKKQFPIKSMGEIEIIESMDEHLFPSYDAYIKVQYEETIEGRTNKKEGWVPADSLSAKELAPLYRHEKKPVVKDSIAAKKDPDCPPKTPGKTNEQQISKITGQAEAYAIALEKKFDEVFPLVGQCLMTKPNEQLNFKEKLTYDEKILPAVKAAAAKSKNPTPQQIIEIDAVARTLYAEMAGCYKKGLQYPMAVARIILNRKTYAERKNNGLFIRLDSPHDSAKLTGARAATEPSQFSTWLREINNKANPSLKHVMCPPSGKKDFYWKNNQVTEQEKSIWEQSVKIATEMTIYPEELIKRTPGLDNVHYFTSGGARIKGIDQKIQTSIEGRPLNLSSCINVFKNPPGGI